MGNGDAASHRDRCDDVDVDEDDDEDDDDNHHHHHQHLHQHDIWRGCRLPDHCDDDDHHQHQGLEGLDHTNHIFSYVFFMVSQLLRSVSQIFTNFLNSSQQFSTFNIVQI